MHKTNIWHLSHQAWLRLAAAMLALALMASELAFSVCQAAAYRPASGDTVLLELDKDTQVLAQQNAARRAVATDPAIAIARAGEFIALGRSKNDERYFGYASATLSPWRQDEKAPIAIVLLRADIAQHQHRFSAALAILDGVIARDANSPRVYLLRATVRMAQGQPQLAKRDCQRLLALREMFIGTVCIAQAASLNGQLRASYHILLPLLQNVRTDGDHEQLAWALATAAEMADRLGDLHAAAQLLQRSLELSPTDLVSRLQLCDVLLRMHAPQRVMAILETTPASEPVILRRALAAKQLNNAALAHSTLQAWLAAVSQSAQFGVRLHLRELARGELELLQKPQQSLTTALDNWNVQREPADARILYQAARAANNQQALQMVRNWQRDLKFEDAELTHL